MLFGNDIQFLKRSTKISSKISCHKQYPVKCICHTLFVQIRPIRVKEQPVA